MCPGVVGGGGGGAKPVGLGVLAPPPPPRLNFEKCSAVLGQENNITEKCRLKRSYQEDVYDK